MRKPRQHHAPATLITAAEPSQADQLRSRQKRYLIMMGTRILCLVGAATAYSFQLTWAIPVFIVGMVALPWMAVLIANDRPPRRPSRFRRPVIALAPDRATVEAPARRTVIEQ